MKVTRCKDCAKNGRHDCLLAIIENRTLRVAENLKFWEGYLAHPDDEDY